MIYELCLEAMRSQERIEYGKPPFLLVHPAQLDLLSRSEKHKNVITKETGLSPQRELHMILKNLMHCSF